MKTRLACAALAAVTVLGILYSGVEAQNPAGANATKFGIAVVDVGYIFKNHQGFKTKMEAMKKEVEGIEGQLKGQRDQIAQRELQKQDYTVGSPEYKKIDDEVAQMKANFSVHMTRLRKEFLDKEAKVYFDTHQEVEDVVSRYAQHYQIGVVLRFNGEDADPNLRDDVLRVINKPVVYQNNVDITPDILALLNRASQPQSRTAQPQQPARR